MILDRIEPGEPQPAYCTHGRAVCVGGCQEWLWLGSETVKVVQRGAALPLCRQCAVALMPSGMPVARRVEDHLRAHGPH